MALNIGDPRTWVSGGFTPDSGDPESSYTGFGNFYGQDVQGNVPSARPVANSFFESSDTASDRPIYLAMSAPLREALPGLARRARKGDLQAVYGYQQAYNQLQDDDRVYDVARGYRLNDANASDLVRTVRETGDASVLGPGTSQYRENLAGYLAQQAIQRGASVRELGVSEQMLDETFKTSFLAALAGASDVSPMSAGIKDRFEKSPGMLMNSSLFLRKGLSDWEQKNGLRSDSMRASILTRAAEYYARSMSIEGLNQFAREPARIIQAAVESAGAVAGPVKENVFDAYNNAVANLDNIISYSGVRDIDLAAHGTGEGSGTRTAAVRGIKSAYADVIARNLGAGRDAWDFDESTDAQLTVNLETAIDHIAAGSKALPGYQTVRTDLVSKIKDMAQKGSVDITGLLDIYTRPDREVFTPPEAMPGATDYGKIAENAVRDLIVNRSFIRGDPETSLDAPEYTTHGIGQYLDAVMAQVKDSPEELKTAMKSMITDFVHSVNTRTDPISVGSDQAVGFAQGLQDRVNALAASYQLYELGVLPDVVMPGASVPHRWYNDVGIGRGSDQLSGGTRSGARNTYGPLLEALDSYTNGRSTERLEDPMDIYRFQLASLMAQGIRNTIDSRYEGDDLVKRAKAQVAKSSGDRMLSEGLAGVYDAAAKLTRAALDARVQDNEMLGKQAVLGNIVSSMLSDATDPVYARRAREYTAAKMSEIGGKHFSREMITSLTNRYAPAVLQLMRRSLDTGLTKDMWSNPGSFDERMGKLTEPLFSRVVQQAGYLRALAEQEYIRRMQQRKAVSDS